MNKHIIGIALALTVASPAAAQSYNTQRYSYGNTEQAFTNGYDREGRYESYSTNTYRNRDGSSQSFTNGYDGAGRYRSCNTQRYSSGMSFTNCN